MEKLVEEFMKTHLKESNREIKILSTKEEIDKLAKAGQYFVVKPESISRRLPRSADREWKEWFNRQLDTELFSRKGYYSDEIYLVTGSTLKKFYGNIDEVEDDDLLVILDYFSIECDPEFGFDTDEFTDDTGFKSWLLESLIKYNF